MTRCNDIKPAMQHQQHQLRNSPTWAALWDGMQKLRDERRESPTWCGPALQTATDVLTYLVGVNASTSQTPWVWAQVFGEPLAGKTSVLHFLGLACSAPWYHQRYLADIVDVDGIIYATGICSLSHRAVGTDQKCIVFMDEVLPYDGVMPNLFNILRTKQAGARTWVVDASSLPLSNQLIRPDAWFKLDSSEGKEQP
jgi:hypothetical protein